MGRKLGILERFRWNSLIVAGAIAIGGQSGIAQAQTTAEYNLIITSTTNYPDYILANLDITIDTQTNQILAASGTAEDDTVVGVNGTLDPANFNYADPVASDNYINAYFFMQNDYIGEFFITPNNGGNNEYGVPGEDYYDGNINGAYFFYVTNVSLTEVLSAAPEPSAWALMIVGVGLVGSALRYRPAYSPIALDV